jgi:foldase protein PrsA
MRYLIWAAGLMLWAVMALQGITWAQEKNQPEHKTMPPEEQGGRIVAAEVNGVDILLADVMEMASQLGAGSQLPPGHGPVGPQKGPDAETVRKEALDRLISQELAYQKAKQEGIKVEQGDVDAAIKTMMEDAGGAEAFRELLANEKTSEDILRAQVEKNLLLQRIYVKEVLQKISVTEDQMKEEYEKNKDRFIEQEKVSIIDVVLFLDAEDKGSEAKAQEILKKIRENDDDPLKLAPDGSFSVRNYEPKKERDKQLYEEARKLNPGDVSGIIKTGDSMHIIKLKDYLPEKQYAYDEVKLIIEQKLRGDEQNRIAKQWFDGLKKDAKIEVLMESKGQGAKGKGQEGK